MIEKSVMPVTYLVLLVANEMYSRYIRSCALARRDTEQHVYANHDVRFFWRHNEKKQKDRKSS